MPQTDPETRMKGYLKKIAAGPRLSKDLTEEEAEDALALILDEKVSKIRAGVFLIAARMKLETVPENIGYWRAMQNRVSSVNIDLDQLLQIAQFPRQFLIQTRILGNRRIGHLRTQVFVASFVLAQFIQHGTYLKL